MTSCFSRINENRNRERETVGNLSVGFFIVLCIFSASGCFESSKHINGTTKDPRERGDSGITENDASNAHRDGIEIDATWVAGNANAGSFQTLDNRDTSEPSVSDNDTSGGEPIIDASIDNSAMDDAAVVEEDDDAAVVEGDGDAAEQVCGTLRPWQPPNRTASRSVIRNGDGFAAGVYRYVDGHARAGDIDAFDENGERIRSIYPNGLHRFDYAASDIGEVVASRGIVAAVTFDVFYKSGVVGNFNVVINKNDSVHESPLFYQQGGLFDDISIKRYTPILLAIASDDTVIVGITAEYIVSANGESSEIIGPTLGLGKLDASGNVITSDLPDSNTAPGDTAIQMRIDEQDRTIVLIRNEQEPIPSDPEPYTPPVTTRILLFDPDFERINTWTAPSDVRMYAMTPDGKGHVYQVGSQGDPEHPTVWINKLTLPTFDAVWPQSLVTGNG